METDNWPTRRGWSNTSPDDIQQWKDQLETRNELREAFGRDYGTDESCIVALSAKLNPNWDSFFNECMEKWKDKFEVVTEDALNKIDRKGRFVAIQRSQYYIKLIFICK